MEIYGHAGQLFHSALVLGRVANPLAKRLNVKEMTGNSETGWRLNACSWTINAVGHAVTRLEPGSDPVTHSTPFQQTSI